MEPILRKAAELAIPASNPFENDCFNRAEIAENLTRLVQSTQQPFVLSIEAPWGFGKTTFIRMWQASLESQGHVCMSFNAWENDFVEDPLVAFLGEMQKAVDSHVKNLQKTQRSRNHGPKSNGSAEESCGKHCLTLCNKPRSVS